MTMPGTADHSHAVSGSAKVQTNGFKPTGRYCVVIPAFNAAGTIGPLVQQVRTLGLPAIVVDDGSGDRTAAVASEHGALVISHLRNEGKGQALRTGFEYALRTQYDGIVTLDSDGQHDPAEIPQLVKAGELQHAGIVLGNRMSSAESMPPSRRWTNRLMSMIISTLTCRQIPDSQCGFRFIRKELLLDVPLRSVRYEVETELLLSASTRRWKIISVPIRTIYSGHASHIKPFRDTVRFLSLLARHAFYRR